ncbi:MAG: type II toxin-antitoxin system HicA family toxin [Prevotellaceae bacterium]|nr:type II toxin-antitoxin system HicA family toxin [Prevotellaceae bacterium]
MKTNEAIKKLRKKGCYFLEHGKEHDCWFSPITNKRFRIPRHGTQELASGTKKALKNYQGLNSNPRKNQI